MIGKFVLLPSQEVGIVHRIEDGKVVVHTIDQDGNTVMDYNEDSGKVYTRESFVHPDTLTVLEKTDQRIPVSRRRKE